MFLLAIVCFYFVLLCCLAVNGFDSYSNDYEKWITFSMETLDKLLVTDTELQEVEF